MAIFRPKQIIDIFTDFDMKAYRDKGFDTILLDIDNTITKPNTGICDERARKFIDELKKCGYKVVVFSNNTRKRVEMFVDDMDVAYNCWSMKPLPFAYWTTVRRMGSSPKKTIVLGDQLVTDIMGANVSGCYGIYSKQLEEDSLITSFNRRIERFIWRHILHEKV